MKKKRKNLMEEKLKAMARERRNEEIAEHGKPINRSGVEEPKTIYSRKKKHKNKEE